MLPLFSDNDQLDMLQSVIADATQASLGLMSTIQWVQGSVKVGWSRRGGGAEQGWRRGGVGKEVGWRE